MPLYLSEDRLRAADQAAAEAQTSELTDDITRRYAEAQAPEPPAYQLPSLSDLGVTGAPSAVSAAIGVLPSIGRRAAAAAEAFTPTWALPSLESLGVSPKPPKVDLGRQDAGGLALNPPEAIPGPDQTASGTPVRSAAEMGAPTAQPGEIEAYIRQGALRRGKDPDEAVRVALSEGGLDDPVRQSDVISPITGRRENSFGPFQMYMNGGLGNAALARGIDPRNPSQWRETIDFALDHAAANGWGAWNGAKKIGLTTWSDAKPGQTAAPTQQPAVAPPAASGTPQAMPTGEAPRIVPLSTPNTSGKRPATVGMVIHSTNGGAETNEDEYAGTLRHFANPGAEVSANAVIAADGTIAMLGDWDAVAWHAGENNASRFGVELVQTAKDNRAGVPFTDAQYRSLAWLTGQLAQRYGFNIDRNALVGHQEIEQGKRQGKIDPGAHFDWNRYVQEARGYARTPTSQDAGVPPAPAAPQGAPVAQRQQLSPVAAAIGSTSQIGQAETGAPLSLKTAEPMPENPADPPQEGYTNPDLTPLPAPPVVVAPLPDDAMYRQPLDGGTPFRDAWASEPQPPYDPDQGPREQPYPGTVSPIINPDGSVTTERSITVTEPVLNAGRPTNIPTVWGGRVVSDDEAITNAVNSGRTWPSYPTIDAAEDAAVQRSVDLGSGRLTSVGGTSLPYDPRVQDEAPGARELPVQPALPQQPSEPPQYEIQDGRIEPPTPSAEFTPVPFQAPQPQSSLSDLPEDEELAPRTEDARPVYGPPATPAVTAAIEAAQNARAGLEQDQELAPRPAAPGVMDTVLAPGRAIGDAITGQIKPEGLLEPVGGAPRQLQRMEEIEIKAARDMGHDLSTAQGFLTRRRAVEDPAWRARNPDLAAEYDQLAQQFGLTVVGQTGDAARFPRRAQPTVEVLQEQLDTATQAWRRARDAGDERMAALAREQAVELESQLVDARNARLALEPAITSDVGRRLEGAPLRAQSDEPLTATVGRERVSPQDAADLGGPASVPPRSISLNAGLGVVPSEGRRFYHGTAGAFDRPDPSAMPTTGLYGPGYYLTPDPEVAGRYAEIRSFPDRRTVESMQAQLERVRSDLAGTDIPDARRTALQVAEANLTERIAQESARSGPNIRAVDVPNDVRLLDNDAPMARHDIQRIEAAVSRATGEPFRLESYTLGSGGSVRTALYEELGDWAAVNRVLHDAGFDGIQARGASAAQGGFGGDEVVIFPEALGKITNAFSGEAGGGTLGVAPNRGSTIPAQLLGDASNTLSGGVFGAAAGAAMPADTDEERRANALRGAGLGMVGAPIAGRLAGRARGALATPGVTPNQGPRNFANPAAALQAAQAAIGKPSPQGPTAGLSKMEALRRTIVRYSTDNRVDLAELQKEAQRLLGRPLEADEMVTELSRANPSGAAKVMIDDVIRPAVQQVSDQRENLSTLMRLLNNGDVAAATGNPTRIFSGGLTGADSQAAAAHLWSQLTPEQQKVIDQSSDALYRMVDHYRDEMVRAGVWTPQLAADLKQQYPHWVPTKILEYMSDPATATTGTRGISLRDRGLRKYTIDGTAKDAEDPIASLVRYVQEAESIIQKNETFNAFVNLRDQVPGWDQLIREVPSNTTPARARGEKAVTGFVNGERKTYLVPAPMAAAIQMEQGQQVPVLRQLTQLFKEFITRTPMFVAGQVPLDAFAYTVREAAREGGPQATPRVLAELGKGYAEAFRGLLDGSFQGDAARYLREGGGMAGFYERSADAASKTLDDLTRRNMFEVKNAADARKLAGWLLGGEWVQAAGARVELAPRVASFRLGERRALRAGASAEKAALEGMIGARDVTLDFQRGGTAAKIANQIIPFFNVGVQSATTLPRVLRENPKGAAATLLSLVAAPTMAAEAWNRLDEQRSKDYDDVPDYVKDRGIVIMLPGVEGRDERGERRPNYALIPMRELAPVAILSRDLMQRAMGTSQRGVAETAQAILGAASPVQASGAADLFSSTLPPGASTGLQLAADEDFFRGGPIATTRRDEQASSLATGIADATGYRPSQVDFGIRDTFGGAGAMASAASDLATGKRKDEDRVQNAPVVGGLLSRFVGDAVGGNLVRAQDAMRTPEVRKVLRDAGLRDDQLSPLDMKGPNDFPFTRQEQAKAQALMNQYLTDQNGVASLPGVVPNWSALPQAAKQNVVRNTAAAARARAEAEVMNGIPEADRQRRFAAASKQKAR